MSRIGLSFSTGLALATLAGALPLPVSSEAAERDTATVREAVRSLFERMPAERKRLLSAGGQNLSQWALVGTLGDRGEAPQALAALAVPPAPVVPGMPAEPGRERLVRVSDPSTDFRRSVVTGFVQSETSSAWCGRNVVVGFNDSGSILESAETGGGLSVVGYSRSDNGGASFEDLGVLSAGPDPNTILEGDPVVACTSPDSFRFASLYLAFGTSTISSGVSVSTSSDGGATFGPPAVAVAKDAFEHFLDKDWMAADPAHPERLYVTYTDFGNFGVSPACADFPTTIELVRSTDGGLTWSAPLVLDEVCGFDAALQGSQVSVGPAGEVYVAWERFPSFVTRSQILRRSTDGGASFGPAVQVADVACVGDCSSLRGGFRSGLEFPSLAVDRSNGPRRGTLYLAWNDGRGASAPDQGAVLGVYGYADILISRSSDGGSHWTPPLTVNQDRPGRTTDQYQPALAVDRRGQVGVCYYDRSLDPLNYLVTRTCSTSPDAGATWRSERITDRGFAPIHGVDVQIAPNYIGDYDTLASDTLLRGTGFLGGFVTVSPLGNQDVVLNHPD